LLHKDGFLAADLGNGDDAEELDGEAAEECAGGALFGKEDGLGARLGQEVNSILVGDAVDVVVDLGDDGLDDCVGGAPSLVVLNDGGAAALQAGADNLEGREAGDAQAAAKVLIGVLVAVDGGDLGQAIEVLSGLFIGGLEVLAVTAPGRVELDNLNREEDESVSRFDT
jgi:hypothetical protein